MVVTVAAGAKHVSGQLHAYQLPPTGPADVERFPALNFTLLHLVWLVACYVGAAWLVAVQLPFSITLWLTPKGAVHSAALHLARTVYEWTLPAVDLIQHLTHNVLFGIDTTLDRAVRTVITTHNANMLHFKTALEAYLRLIQEKSELVERHGLRGLPLVFTRHAPNGA